MSKKFVDILRNVNAGKKYKIRKGEDGTENIPLAFPDSPEGLQYEMYGYSKDYLAALLPVRAAMGIVRKYPELVTMKQSADDGIVLAFTVKAFDRMRKDLRPMTVAFGDWEKR